MVDDDSSWQHEVFLKTFLIGAGSLICMGGSSVSCISRCEPIASCFSNYME